MPPSKIADFAGEAAPAGAAVMGDYTPARQVALLAALMLTAQAKARDDTAEMFCRRVATLTKRSRSELGALKQQHREITGRLVASYRSVPEHIGPDGSAAAKERAALASARKAVHPRARAARGTGRRRPRRPRPRNAWKPGPPIPAAEPQRGEISQRPGYTGNPFRPR